MGTRALSAWLVVVGGRAGLLGFAFFGNLLIIRALGPHDFGVYALCVALIKVFGEIVGESLDLALRLDLLTPSTALIVYVVTSFAVFGIGLRLLPRDVWLSEPPTRSTLVETLNYSKWTMIALAIAAVIERAVPDFVAGCAASVLRPRFVPAYLKGEFGRSIERSSSGPLRRPRSSPSCACCLVARRSKRVSIAWLSTSRGQTTHFSRTHGLARNATAELVHADVASGDVRT